MHVGIMLLCLLKVRDGGGAGGQVSSTTPVFSEFLTIYANFDKIMVKHNFHNTALKMLILKHSCGEKQQ